MENLKVSGYEVFRIYLPGQDGLVPPRRENKEVLIPAPLHGNRYELQTASQFKKQVSARKWRISAKCVGLCCSIYVGVYISAFAILANNNSTRTNKHKHTMSI